MLQVAVMEEEYYYIDIMNLPEGYNLSDAIIAHASEEAEVTCIELRHIWNCGQYCHPGVQQQYMLSDSRRQPFTIADDIHANCEFFPY
jgi:hypothetical protein